MLFFMFMFFKRELIRIVNLKIKRERNLSKKYMYILYIIYKYIMGDP